VERDGRSELRDETTHWPASPYPRPHHPTGHGNQFQGGLPTAEPSLGDTCCCLISSIWTSPSHPRPSGNRSISPRAGGFPQCHRSPQGLPRAGPAAASPAGIRAKREQPAGAGQPLKGLTLHWPGLEKLPQQQPGIFSSFSCFLMSFSHFACSPLALFSSQKHGEHPKAVSSEVQPSQPCGRASDAMAPQKLEPACHAPTIQVRSTCQKHSSFLPP